jgi:uncharacterized protein YndB with AHSA1/START domain
MKVVKWMLIVVVGLVAVFLVGAMLITPTYKVERGIVINAPAKKIYPLVADPKAWKRWSIWDQREPNMKVAYSGAPAGQGAKWAWESKDGKGSMEFTAAEPDKSLRYLLTFIDMGTTSTGAFTFRPEGNGTRVSWTNEGDMGGNPMMRWFAPFMEKMIGPDFDGGLANLKALAEKS